MPRLQDAVDALAGTRPFTVFAPTDTAFAKLPKSDLDALLADKAKLSKVLTYHVVSGKDSAAELVKLQSVKTVESGSLPVKAADAGVSVDGAKVSKTGIMTSNGVIHVIDTVHIPKM